MSDPSPSPPTVQPKASQAAEHLLPLLYQDLRRIAAHRLSLEAPGQTLQPTALVHEAWLRLNADPQRNYSDRTHFFAVAAETMRRILIDRARHRKALRHGGGQERADADVLDRIASPTKDDRLLSINEALDRLAVEYPRQAELVKLRFFVGLTLEDAAEILGVAVPTAKRDWAFARAWLYRDIEM